MDTAMEEAGVAEAAASWDDPPRRKVPATAPILAVDGFEGPLDWLLEMTRAQKLDLARLSIVALIDAFADAMATALARGPGAATPDLTQWAAWTVMAAQLTELRSRLLLPGDAPTALAAQDDAEALRQHWLRRAAMARAADWLERRPQLGVDVFARGRKRPGRRGRLAESADMPGDGDTDDGTEADAEAASEDAPPVAGGDLTDLLRACLVALRLPPDASAYQLPRPPFWRVSDATARISQLLPLLPDGGTFGLLLPGIVQDGAERALHCRAAVAATLVASLELTRDGALTLHQEAPWQPIRVHHRS